MPSTRPSPQRTDESNRLTVVIATHNEASGLPSTIDALLAAADHVGETLRLRVVDAGSTDGTPDIAEAYGAVVHHTVVPSLAVQFNYGSAGVRSGILWFIRVGTRVPPEAIERLRAVMSDPQVLAGGFVRFYDTQSRLLRSTCRLAAWRGRRYGWIRGNQAFFVRAEVFHAMEGFSETAHCETLELARRLRAQGPTVLIDPPVISSARRFQRLGPLRQTLCDLRMALQSLRQHSPHPGK